MSTYCIYVFNMSFGNITYDRPKNAATTPTQLESEYKVSFPANNKVLIESFFTLDPANVAQVSTVTILLGSTGDEIAVEIEIGATSWVYRHKQTATDTVNSIASFLATLIDTNPNIAAKAVLGVITLTSVVPGQPFEVDTSTSTDPANSATATTAAATGTILHRKISETELTFAVNSAGFPIVSCSGKWYDGASVPVVKQTFGPLLGAGNSTVDSIQTAAGVPRPN